MKQRIARLISGILNPFIVSLFTIILMVWQITSTWTAALKWIIIALLISVIPVFLFSIFQVRRKKMDSIFPEGQGQRKLIYLTASILALIGCVVMWRFNAPKILAVAFVAGLTAVVIFMVINIFWKISLHMAFISSSAVVLTLVIGPGAAWMFLLLPLVAWSRLELKMHTPAQVTVGATLAAALVAGIFWGFGMV